MRGPFLIAIVLLAGCATLYPPPGQDPQVDVPTTTYCGVTWSGVDIQAAQKLENAFVRAVDTCTADKEHWDATLACKDLKGWTVDVLPRSAVKLDTKSGRLYFAPPPASQLPSSEQNLHEAYGLTQCAKYTTTLADADWSNGAAATELLHAMDRCTSTYATWNDRGFSCAVKKVQAQFAVPR